MALHGQSQKPWDGWVAVALGVGVTAVVAHLALRPMEETDLFFRLAAGEQTLQRHAPLHENLFSFTHPAHPYVDSAWLFDLGAALLYRAGGFPALVLAKGALLACVFIAAFALARRKGAGPFVAAAVMAIAAYTVEPRMVERPHLFSFAFGVALLWILQSGWRTDAHLAKGRAVWLALVPPVVAFWANLHAGAFIAPIFLLAAAAGVLLDRRRATAFTEGNRPSRRDIGVLILAAVASAGALVITPVGFDVFRYLAFHVDINTLHPVDEFRAPDLRSDTALCLFGVVAAIGLLPWRRAPRVSWREWLPLLVVAALAARYVRFGADFVVLAAPSVAARATVLLHGWWGDWFTRHRLPAKARAGLAVVAAYGALITVASVRTSAGPLIELGMAKGLVPDEAIAFIEKHQLADRMYNDFEMGGYLAWRWFPRHRVFVDPRLPAYPTAFHALLGRDDLSRDQWDQALRGFDVDSALITHAGVNPRTAWWDPEGWALLFRKDDARVFVRRLPRWRELIARHEIPATFVASPGDGTHTEPLFAPPHGSPVPVCEWQLRLGDLLFDLDGGADTRALAAYGRALDAADCLLPARRNAALAWVGATLVRHQRWAEALPVIEAAINAGMADGAGEVDDQRALHANRAVTLEALQRQREAAEAWAEVARARPDDEVGRKAAARAALLGNKQD